MPDLLRVLTRTFGRKLIERVYLWKIYNTCIMYVFEILFKYIILPRLICGDKQKVLFVVRQVCKNIFSRSSS